MVDKISFSQICRDLNIILVLFSYPNHLHLKIIWKMAIFRREFPEILYSEIFNFILQIIWLKIFADKYLKEWGKNRQESNKIE